jgi:hypothetical protein
MINLIILWFLVRTGSGIFWNEIFSDNQDTLEYLNKSKVNWLD